MNSIYIINKIKKNKIFLKKETINNLKEIILSNFLPKWYLSCIYELFHKKAWEEINDRFYKFIDFGTGGARGRTIGKIITSHEIGYKYFIENIEFVSPSYPSIGINYLNDFNIIRITIGLFKYFNKINKNTSFKKPILVVSYDTRHFSKHFCLLTASTWSKLGGKVFIFNGPRSTPQLSYTVRNIKADFGVMITASHNPYYDNGYKIYGKDGGQMIDEDTKILSNEINTINWSIITKFLNINLEEIKILPNLYDEYYINNIKKNILESNLLKKYSPNIIYSPVHGIGKFSIIKLMDEFNIKYHLVKKQLKPDPYFSTVISPNPESSEVFNESIKKGIKENADFLICTDPDGDRLGIAAKDINGNFKVLNGNSIGSILLNFRINQLKKLDIIPYNGSNNAVVIKTFVTSPLQEKIALENGVKCVNTLTGFKWIGKKLYNYEVNLKNKIKNIKYNSLSLKEKSKIMLKHSKFFIFGSEESCGYLSNDNIRDKDANETLIQFCLFGSFINKNKINIFEYLDNLYIKYGYFKEELISLYYEGSKGSNKIKSILKSYKLNLPKSFGEFKIKKINNFSKEKIKDEDNQLIPSQDFYLFKLSNGLSFAVRASGTEPKIKFYIFSEKIVKEKKLLEEIKKNTDKNITLLKKYIIEDANIRSNLYK